MRWYFELQFKMLNRHLKDFGIPPLLAYLVLITIFILGSNLIFYTLENEFGTYCYSLLSILTLIKLREKKRNDFLKLSFTKKSFYKVKILENLILVTPFVLYLIYQREYIFTLYLYVIALLFSKLAINLPSSFVIPTPFSKKPFEFSVGFRKSFFVFPIIYWLTYKAVEIENFNLGIFALIALFIVLISYYTKMENEFYVWSFKYTPKEFLLEKIKIGTIYALLLSLPIFVTLSLFFIQYIAVIIVFQCLCFLYLIQAIIAKYADFPKQMHLPNAMIFWLSISLPPLTLFTFRYFYNKSIQNLKSVLND